LASVAVNIVCIWPMTNAWGLQGTAASFMVSEALGVVIGLMLTRYAYRLPYLLAPLGRTLLASGLMAGVVLALERLLPVPGIAAFAVLAASGMLVYGLAAIGLIICDARGVLHTLALKVFATAERG
jgi:O-antigen/teichoic acid export membrane protein